jgi:hypothetical protein
VDDDLVCAGSYGMQLAGYDRETGELLGLLEELPDYPKALSMVHDAAGVPYLLVGCRTGLLSLYRLDRRRGKLRFRKLRDHWLPRRPAAFTLVHHDHAAAGRTAVADGEAACVR